MADTATHYSEIQDQAQAQAAEAVDHVVDSVKGALESGLRMQEEITRWWGQTVARDGLAQRWVEASREMVETAVPPIRDNTEECLKVIDNGYQQARQLIRKTLDASEYRFLMDAYLKVEDLVASSQTVARNQTQLTLQVLNQMTRGWGEALRRNADQARGKVKEAIRKPGD